MNGQPESPGAEEREFGADDSQDTMDAAVEDDGRAEAAGPEALQALADENWDKYLRAMAELDNVRKRASRDVQNARKFALEPFARDLLDVRDSLEMGLSAASGSEGDAIRAGFEATLKQLAAMMERFGIDEIDPHGEPFDPQLHEAMTTQPTADAEPGTVLTVFQKGYSLHGRLLRPARVVVAEAVSEAAGSE
ncbi:MAG: nucleotide exchange factor GrpE [Woeseia sp.]|nr:nucleotide exchange factor GrpE [Woeseia sp.]